MDETNLDPDSTDTKQALRVVIAYNDVAVGKRAMRVLADLGKGLGEDIEFHPLPWSFDLLADMNWREVAAHDAVKADILIIATSSTNPLPSAVERWAKATISQKRGTAAAVVALFGSDENPDGAGSSRLEAIRDGSSTSGSRLLRARAAPRTRRGHRANSSAIRDGHAASRRNPPSSATGPAPGAKRITLHEHSAARARPQPRYKRNKPRHRPHRDGATTNLSPTARPHSFRR